MVEAGHLQLGAPVPLGGPWGLEKDHVIVSGRNAARTVGDGLIEQFIDAGAESGLQPATAIPTRHVIGTIDHHTGLNAPEGMFRAKLNVPSGAVALPSVRRGAQAHGGVIPDFAVVVDDSAGPAEIGDAMDWIVQDVGISGVHVEAHFIAHGLGGGAGVSDFVDCSGVRAAVGEKPGRVGRIGSSDVKLHLGIDGLAGQDAKVAAGAVPSHGGALPRPLIDAVKDGGVRDAVRIGNGQADPHWLEGGGDQGAVPQAIAGRTGVGNAAAVGGTWRADGGGLGEDGGAGGPVEIKAGVQLGGAAEPFGPEGYFVGFARSDGAVRRQGGGCGVIGVLCLCSGNEAQDFSGAVRIGGDVAQFVGP